MIMWPKLRTKASLLCCRFLEVDVPAQPFPPPQNEGAGAMLLQLGRFWWRHPLAALGLRDCDCADSRLDLRAL